MMKHIFSPAGKIFLNTVMEDRPLLAFDFDGTLAPIVANPREAAVPLAVGRRLAALAEVLPVAIVSGRSVHDVKGRLSFCPAFVIGNHGAEGWDSAADQELKPLFDEVRALLAAQRDVLDELGVVVEDKGLSVALHYRIARDRAAAKAFVKVLLTKLASPLAVSFGKCVANITAVNAPDKGVALHRLVRQAKAHSAVFVGDDSNDEPAFSSAESHWLTVRIGNRVRGSKARFYLDDHAQVATFLQDMVDLVRP
jgi:trehalose 6-phosphate phosphatase